MRSAAPHPDPWTALSGCLGGSFAARARGLLASEFALSGQDGEEFGRLRVHGPQSAGLEAGDLQAEIERTARWRYRMVAGGAESLVAEIAGSSGVVKTVPENRAYEARFHVLRNTAVALSPGGEVRVTGGLTNRSYTAVFDAADGGSLLVAVFLLHYTVGLRRSAFLAGRGERPR
jgi:hypothetical protein